LERRHPSWQRRLLGNALHEKSLLAHGHNRFKSDGGGQG